MLATWLLSTPEAGRGIGIWERWEGVSLVATRRPIVSTRREDEYLNQVS